MKFVDNSDFPELFTTLEISSTVEMVAKHM